MKEITPIAKISVLATPIGNLGDITYRGVAELAKCDLVVAEDTRNTRFLLDHYNIKRPIISYHSQSKLSKTDKIIELLKEDKHLVLVSDAGTPCISDPGSQLIAIIKKELPNILIEALPGPSAVIAGLSIAGVPTDKFTFFGFLPHKKGRQTMQKEMLSLDHTAVFYESTHRIEKMLQELKELGINNKQLTICKELTKMHEQIIQDTNIDNIITKFKNDDKLKKGEFAVILSNI